MKSKADIWTRRRIYAACRSAAHVRATYLRLYPTVIVGLPAAKGWLKQNGVRFTVKMKTPVKIGAMPLSEILLGIF